MHAERSNKLNLQPSKGSKREQAFQGQMSVPILIRLLPFRDIVSTNANWLVKSGRGTPMAGITFLSLLYRAGFFYTIEPAQQGQPGSKKGRQELQDRRNHDH